MIANTSARFALVRAIKQTDTRTLKPAMMPRRADMDWTQYSTKMDAIGIRDATMLVIQ